MTGSPWTPPWRSGSNGGFIKGDLLSRLEWSTQVHMNVLEGPMHHCLLSVFQIIHGGFPLLTDNAGHNKGSYVLLHVGLVDLLGHGSMSVLYA